MKYDSTKTSFGNIRIHKGVITSMVSIATLETEGVAGLYSTIKDELIKLFAKDYAPGVNVIVDKNDEITISVSINIKYEFNISKVASKVQENIRLRIDKIADINVKDINVNIKGVEKKQN